MWKLSRSYVKKSPCCNIVFTLMTKKQEVEGIQRLCGVFSTVGTGPPSLAAFSADCACSGGNCW